jgi:hypothetical protein
MLAVVGPTGPDYDQQHCYPQAPTVDQRLLLQHLLELLMMGMGMPKTRKAASKRQVTNLRSCRILSVDSVESMMMHGLANPKSLFTVYLVTLSLAHSTYGNPQLRAFTLEFYSEQIWSEMSCAYDFR